MLFRELSSPWETAPQVRLLQDRLNKLFANLPDTRRGEFPPINIWANDEKAILVAEVPGIEPNDIDLQVVNQTLTLKTKRQAEQATEDQSWHRQERGHGEFSRSIELPYAIDAEKIQATCSQGVLRIELCRAAADIPKKISIKAS